MIRRITCVVVLLVVSTATGMGQDFFYRAFDADQATGGVVIGPPDLDVIGVDPLVVGRAVLNAPYTAEAITEITQVLADGNRIEQRTAATIARDSRGRTRREQQGIALGRFVAMSSRPLVTITDPTTGLHFTLNYEEKIAFRAKPGQFNDKVQARREAARGASGTMASRPAGRLSGTPAFEAPTPREDPTETVFETPAARDRKTPEIVPFAGTVHTITLEPQTLEGIRAEGSKTVLTIPADAMGNVLPLQILSERWYSPDLGIVLLTRRFDPRFGETVYRLTNIDRSEPSPDLFIVPADFKVRDVPFGRVTPIKPE